MWKFIWKILIIFKQDHQFFVITYLSHFCGGQNILKALELIAGIYFTVNSHFSKKQKNFICVSEISKGFNKDISQNFKFKKFQQAIMSHCTIAGLVPTIVLMLTDV